MSTIQEIVAREVLDSRGWPTVEVDVHLQNGGVGRVSVPSGASVGKFEAHVLLDGDEKRYFGRGVAHKVITHVRDTIAPALIGKKADDQKLIDSILCELDGTNNKSKLGANNILAVSLAVAKAQSNELGLPLFRYLGGVQSFMLPTPMMNIINGGMHANNKLAIQEFMIMPIGASSFAHALQMGCEVFQTLKNILADSGQSTAVGDEGGFAPDVAQADAAIELILQAIEKAGYKPGSDLAIALDAAASNFYDAASKTYKLAADRNLSTDELLAYWEELAARYPIVSIEDPFDEADAEGWTKITQKMGHTHQIVGDDIFVSQVGRLQDGIQKNQANAILIKPNQVGTLSETLETMLCARFANYRCILSHRSGETEDVILADLALATNCGQIKAGSLSRSERLCKYNQLLRLEEELNAAAVYAGRYALAPFLPALAKDISFSQSSRVC